MLSNVATSSHVGGVAVAYESARVEWSVAGCDMGGEDEPWDVADIDFIFADPKALVSFSAWPGRAPPPSPAPSPPRIGCSRKMPVPPLRPPDAI